MVKLPKNVSELFWDVEKKGLEEHEDFVIERILEMGNDGQVKWMLENIDKENIGGVLKKSKKVSQKSANYWAKYFNYSVDQIECLKKELPERQNRFC